MSALGLSVVDDSDAALKAHAIDDLRGTLEVLSESVGVKASGGRFSPFIHAGTIIPRQQTEVMSTADQGQQELEFWFFRRVGRRVSENRPIGKVQVVGIPPQKTGAPRIELMLRIQLTGDLQISARDPASGEPPPLRQISP